jgi:hypothetical protein
MQVRSLEWWACCGSKNGVRSCNAPTKETFDAPQTNQLATLFTVGATLPSSTHLIYGTSTSSRASSLSATSYAAQSPESSRLPLAAYGLIGSGVALAVFVVVGAGVLLCRRKKSNDDPKMTSSPFNQRSSLVSEVLLNGEHEGEQTLHRITIRSITGQFTNGVVQHGWPKERGPNQPFVG